MIDLSNLRRVQLQRGRLIHEVRIDPRNSMKITACGSYVHLYDPWGRAQDKAIEPEKAVTCPRCLAAPTPKDPT